MSKGRIAEEQQTVMADGPVDLAVAGLTGDFVSLSNYNHVAILYSAGVGAAGQDPTITVQQATSNAGAGAKPLTFTELYQKEAVDIQTVGQFTKITQAAANTYISLTGGESEQVILIEFDAAALDVDNGFDHVQVAVDDPGATTKLAVCHYLLTQPRNAEEPALSAL